MNLKLQKVKAAGDKAWDSATNMKGVKDLLGRTSPARLADGEAGAAGVAAVAAAGDGAGGSAATPTTSGSPAQPGQGARANSSSSSSSSDAPAQGGGQEEGCALQEPAGGSTQLALQAPAEIQVHRGQVVWALLAVGLFVAGVVLVSVGTGALWHDSAAALAMVSGLRQQFECSKLGCAAVRAMPCATRAAERVARCALQHTTPHFCSWAQRPKLPATGLVDFDFPRACSPPTRSAPPTAA